MSAREPVDLSKAYLLLNHGPVTLVTSAHGGRRNVMAASWVMPLDFRPPKVAVAIDSRTLTRELVEASGEFVLDIPPRSLAHAVLAAFAGGRGHFEEAGKRTIHYLAGGSFFAAGEAFEV